MFALMFAVILVASCATKAPTPVQEQPVPAVVPTPVETPVATPVATPEPVPEPVKVAKQRTVVTKVPVLIKEASFYSDGLADAYAVYKLDADMKNVVEKDSYDAARSSGAFWTQRARSRLRAPTPMVRAGWSQWRSRILEARFRARSS